MARFPLKFGKVRKAPQGMNKGNLGPFHELMMGLPKQRLANATSRPQHGMVTRQQNAEKAYERGRAGAQLGRGTRAGGGATNMGSGSGKAMGSSPRTSIPLRKPTAAAPTDARIIKAARGGSRKAAKRISARY